MSVGSIQRVLFRTLLRHVREVRATGRPLVLHREVEVNRWGRFRYGDTLNPVASRDVLRNMLPESMLALPLDWPKTVLVSAAELRDLVVALFRAPVPADALAAEEHLDHGFLGLRVLASLTGLHQTTSVSVTEGVRIITTSTFVEKDDRGNDVYAYRVLIENLNDYSIKLVGRHWIFQDGAGDTISVDKFAQGVVGQQPYLRPQQWFEYVSGVNLKCSPGQMQGSMLLTRDSGDDWEAVIPPLALLSQPDQGSMQ
uniref:ApaG domain-containing protein n=1 Tax=Rhizochromulina marina TaxID=1034831 RepID=A0A7S2W786_9STRA|mmetsp:Transcript_16980/g.49490  ORF Transcript_16980/g.49490 Transcript_16980/m.49490 type:complete len:255 (+) Transcript_16980:71-835(+)